jgi:hypothetical protein
LFFQAIRDKYILVICQFLHVMMDTYCGKRPFNTFHSIRFLIAARISGVWKNKEKNPDYHPFVRVGFIIPLALT